MPKDIVCRAKNKRKLPEKKKKKSVSPSDTFRLFMYPSNKATDDVIQGRNTNVIPSTTILFMNNFLPTIWNMISDKSYRLTETLNEVFLLLLLLLLNPSSHVQLCATLWTVAFQTPLSMGSSRQELLFSSHSIMSDSVTPRTAACQASSSTISQSLLKLVSVESVMPSNHLILCRPLLLLPPIFPSIRVFSNEPALRIRWPKY